MAGAMLCSAIEKKNKKKAGRKTGHKGAFKLRDQCEDFKSAGMVRHVFNPQVQPQKHVAQALEVLKTLKRAA